MKRFFLTFVVALSAVLSVNAMSYSEARSQALYLADLMAYELELSDAQYVAVYEINLDYFLSVSDENDLYGSYWTTRNSALEYVLSTWQYIAYKVADYFYRPLSWVNGRWSWLIYSRYDSKTYYKSKPKSYSSYKGGERKADDYKGKDYNAPSEQRYQAPSTSKNSQKDSKDGIYTNQRQYDSSRKASEKEQAKQDKQESKQQAKQSKSESQQSARQSTQSGSTKSSTQSSSARTSSQKSSTQSSGTKSSSRQSGSQNSSQRTR